MAADFIQVRSDGIGVSDRFGTQIRDTVGFFAGFHHFVDHAGDGSDMSGNLANQATGLF